jgi:pyruvate-formate lyase-activating enzyme
VPIRPNTLTKRQNILAGRSTGSQITQRSNPLARGVKTAIYYQFPVQQMPHAVVEINRTCNIQCHYCYNLDKSSVKSLEEVKAEIDTILRLRNVQALTLLGGEPTLHPDLPEIIAYVKGLGRKCLLLTNGVVLAGEGGEALLDRLVAAGIDKVAVHIDSGQQHVHADVDGSRRTVFSRLEARKVTFSLAVTIYPDKAGELPQLVRRYAEYRYFDGILSFLAREGLRSHQSTPRLEAESASIARELGLEPVSYIPNNLADGGVRWLIYFYIMNAATGAALGLSPTLCRLFGRLYRVFAGRRFFIVRTQPSAARWLALLLGFASAVLHPSRTGAAIRLLRKSAGGKGLRFQQIIIQNPAEYNERLGRLEFCYHCPDATLRNGRLVPVCIADYIDPPPGQESSAADDLAREVQMHLGPPTPR